MSGDTRQTIMDLAKGTVQARGYNALSFRELAKDVGIKSASIHYYFPTKGDLGAALARQYADQGQAYLEEALASGKNLRALMDRYTAIFRGALSNDNRMCLCGIMAAERSDLPAEVIVEIDRFTEINVAWLAKVLGHFEGQPEKAARAQALAIFAAIEGAQLVARGAGDVAVFDAAIEVYRTKGLLS